MQCIFCDIVSGAVPAEILYEDELAVAFHDSDPMAPVHILVVPRQHISGPVEFDESNKAIAGHLIAVAAKIAREEGFAGEGYRLVLNQGHNGGQSVFHVHLHVLAGRRLSWPPG